MGKNLKSKAAIIIVFIVLVVLTILGVFTFKYIQNKDKPFNTTSKVIDLKVQKGEYLYGVLGDLEAKGMMKNTFFTKLYLKLNSSSSEIKPGDYEIPSNTTLENFINMLVEGKVATYKVTFPEGFTIEKMADRLQSEGVMNADVFLTAVKNYPLPSYIKPNPERRYNLEGFLYPDTYDIPKNATADDIISMMLNQFQKEMLQAQQNTGVKVNEADYQKYVTIASMIEGEAQTQKDRELVSSVIENRTAKDMKLQLDATVLYALGEHQSLVSIKDTQVKSPYNTYYIKGLPIGAINNPGIDCLEAALKPAKTDYLYYILTDNGNIKEHFFTSSFAEFNKAYIEYNKKLKENK